MKSRSFPIHVANVLESAGLNPTEFVNPPSVLYDRDGPVITVVTLVHVATGIATTGIARLHPRDQFSRPVARALAFSRAVGPMVRFWNGRKRRDAARAAIDGFDLNVPPTIGGPS